MPRKITTWGCDYCGVIHGSARAARAHERLCLHNHITHACPTCAREQDRRFTKMCSAGLSIGRHDGPCWTRLDERET